MNISVITPSFNPRADYLARVFDGLKAQTLPKSEWEYLIIDNNSNPPIEGRFDLSWHDHARIVREEELGLTPARLRGIAEARGDILVFVDDDCVLREDYLANAIELMDNYPHVGAWGAYLEGEFEEPVPEWLKEFAWTLCAMQYFKQPRLPLQYAMATHASLCTPAGAGMVIRSVVARRYAQDVAHDAFRRLLDRQGTSLSGCGDSDMAYCSIDMGMATGTSLSLHLTHIIPARRMQVEYLRKILYAGNYSSARLLLHRGWRKPGTPPPAPTAWGKLKRFVRDLRSRSEQSILWEAQSKGYTDGLAGLPFDERYR